MANKKCMVFETLGPTTSLQIQESKNTNEVRMTGVFGVCGVKNENRRIYSKENYGMMVENLQKVITTEGLLGELEHPDSMNINLNNVSHKIESIEMNEDGTITGTILLLDTAKGKDAKAIVAGGVPLYISSRGAGSIDESGHVTLSTIKTYDLVGTPGFAQAKLNLKANQTLECLNESAEEGNEIWAIVDESEEDDLLGDKKNDDDQKDDAKSEKEDSNKEDSNKEDKADDAEDKKEEDEDEKKDTSDKDDNNKNSDNNTTMTELKQAIDQLAEKVTSLEAELHVAQESLTKNQNKLTAIEESLEKANDTINEKDDEIASLREKVNAFEAIDYNKIESWVKDEFATEFKDELTESINSDVQTWIIENFSDTVQNWVCEEFAPEVQNWVCEEFAPEVQNWICEEFSPEVQNWVCEEFAPVIEGWITEEFGPETSSAIEAKVNENVSAFMENQKDSKLSEIDALLESLDNKDEALEKLVKEQAIENRFAGVYVVEHMPAEYQPSWNTLNEERQNEIVRSSKAYDFTKEGVLESFWQSVDFTNAKENKVNENKEDILNNHYGAVYTQMMRLRRP